MREIKFRGQRVDDKQWVCGYYTYEFERGYCYEAYDDVPSRCSYISNENGEYYKVIPETIGQYTGLKGKNGKEIYEWDIILFHGNNANHILKVEHRNSWYLYIDIRTGYTSQLYGSSEEAFEVIGNIHENPELLKGE